MPVTLTDEERKLAGFHLVCRIDDYEKEIKKSERTSGARNDAARKTHATLVRLVYGKIIPESLTGPLVLMDGTTLEKQA